MNILKNSPALKDLEKLQARALSIGKEIEQVNDAWRPINEAMESLRVDLAGIPSAVAGLHAYAAAREAGNLINLRAPITIVDLAQLMGTEKLFDRLKELIEPEIQPPGLPAAERAKKLEELRASLRQAYKEIERECMRLETVGYTVLRDADADVELLFEVWAEAA